MIRCVAIVAANASLALFVDAGNRRFVMSMVAKLFTLLDITSFPRDLWRNRQLLVQFSIRNLEMRYRGSLLGLFWSFVQPLMMFFIYTFVFSVVFKARWNLSTDSIPGSFPVVMFGGMMMYNVFQESVLMSCGVIIGNQNLVKKVIFPVEILPAAQCIATLLLGLAWLVLLICGVAFVFHRICWTLSLLPVILLPLVMFTLGVCYLVSSLGVFLRDVQYVVGIVLQVLFFMTPVFYPIENVPQQFRPILELNPLSTMLYQGRDVMIFGIVPDIFAFIRSFALAALVLHLGYMWFKKTQRGFADVL